MNKLERYKVNLLKECVKNLDTIKKGLSQPMYSIMEEMKKIDELKDLCHKISYDLSEVQLCNKIENSDKVDNIKNEKSKKYNSYKIINKKVKENAK